MFIDGVNDYSQYRRIHVCARDVQPAGYNIDIYSA